LITKNKKYKKMETKNGKTGIGSGILVLGILGVFIVATLIGGCIGGEKAPDNKSPVSEPSKGGGSVGSLTISGSTTVLPVAQKAADEFMDKNSNVNVQVSAGGSSVGVEAVGTGTADIGMSSRDLKAEEKAKYPDLVEHVIAKDGIAIIVHPSNTVSSLTPEQVKKIYEGTFTNWNELGGDDKKIVVVSRDSASGTREFFWEHVMKKGNFTKTALEKNSNGAIQQTISQTPGAIGYVGLGYLENVKAVKIDKDGVLIEPTVRNVLDNKYPISRGLYMLTNGPATGTAKEYIDFILSAEGQKLVEQEGFVPLS
jgi:phosphate transport system substrate-binding protein